MSYKIEPALNSMKKLIHSAAATILGPLALTASVRAEARGWEAPLRESLAQTISF